MQETVNNLFSESCFHLESPNLARVFKKFPHFGDDGPRHITTDESNSTLTFPVYKVKTMKIFGQIVNHDITNVFYQNNQYKDGGIKTCGYG